MMNKLFLTTLTIMLAFTFSTGANAQALRRTSLPYETYYMPEARNYLAPSAISLKFDGKFDVWYLLGEPVINCTARWLNSEQLSVKTPGGDTIIAEPGEAEVYNMVLVAQIWDPDRDKKRYGDKGGYIAAFCDAGIVAQNGQNGFNVAGSPNWDKFLCNLPSKFYKRSAAPFAAEKKQSDLCEEAGGTWFSAEAAKKMARAGLKFEDVTIKSLEVNVGAAIRRYEKGQWRDKSFAYKASKARAIGERMHQKSLSNLVALSDINYMAMKKGGQTATPALLKEYDEVLTTLQNRLQDGGAFADEWREKDQALVREQLAHVRAIEPDLLREEAKLADYQRKLEDLRNEYLKNQRFDPLDVVPVQDPANQLWGYQVKSMPSWIIKPIYIAAEPFDENGNAKVVVSQEQISMDKVSVNHKCHNGRSWQMLFDRFKYRQKIGIINLKNEVVSDFEFQETQRDKNITTVGSCY